MINWTHRTLIVPTALADQVRALCAAATSAGDGMFTTPLSADGAAPATHYISSGLLDSQFASLLDSPESMQVGLDQLGIEVPLENCEAILSACDVSEEGAHEALSRLGLQLVQDAN